MQNELDLNINTNQVITDLNKALRELSNKMSKLEVKVDFDQSFVQGMNSYAEGMNRLNRTMVQNQLMMQSSMDEYKRIQTIQERQRHMTDAETAAYEKQRKSIKRLEQELEGYTVTKSKANKNQLGEITGYSKTYKNDAGQLLTVNTNNDGEVRNYDKVMERVGQQQRILNQQNRLNQQREIILSEEQATRRALEQQTSRNNESKDRAHQQALQQNAKMDTNLRNSIKETEERIAQASQKYSLNGTVSNGLRSLSNEMLTLNSSMSTVGYKASAEHLARVNEQLKATTRSSSAAGGEIKTLGEVMQGASTMAGGWMRNVTSLIQPMDVLRKAVQSIIQIDGQMNQLERTIGKSFNEERMLDGSINIAQSTGRSMSEVNGNLIGFANRGFDQSETLSLGKAASVLQNISNLTPEESVNTLTGAMTAFNIEATKSMGIADQLKQVSGLYSVSSKDLALSLSSAGAAAKLFGVSMEEVLGNTAAISSITRESGDIVGRGLNTIYSKVASDDPSTGALQEVGISSANKDVITVLDELAGKWNQLTKAEQQNTATKLTALNQSTMFTALMQNWKTSVNASEAALHSQGAAMKDNEQYMGSLGARIQNMQTAWESLTPALGNALVSDSIITITSLVTGLLNWMAQLNGSFYLFGVFGMAIGLLNASLRILVIEITKTVFSIRGIPAAAIAASAGTNALSMSITLLKNSFKALVASTGVGLLFALIGSGLEMLMKLFSSSTQATEDFSDQTEVLNQKVYDLNGLKSLSAEYEILTKQISLSFEEKTRLAQIESELASKYGIYTETVDGQTKSLTANNEAIQTKKTLLEDEIRLEREKAELAYNSNATKIESDIAEKQKEVLKRDSQVEETKTSYLWGKNKMSTLAPGDSEYDYQQRMFEMSAKDYEEALALQKASNESLKALTDQKLAIIKNAGEAYIEAEEQKNVKIQKNTREFLEIYALAATQSGQSAEGIKANLGQVFTEIQNSNIKSPESALKFLNTLPGVGKLTADAFKEVSNILMQMDFSSTVNSTEKLKDSAEVLSEMVQFASDSKQEFVLLNQAQSELANNNKLSTDTIQKMNEKYGDFIKVTGLSKAAILDFIKAEKNKKIEFIDSEIKMTKNAINETRKRIKITEIEIKAYERKSKAANSTKIAELSDQVKEGKISEEQAEQFYAAYRRNNALYNSNGKMIVNNSLLRDNAVEQASLNDLLIQLNVLDSTRSELTETVKNSNKATKDSTSSNDKSNDSLKETIELLTELQLNIQKVDKSLQDLQNKRRLIEPGSAAYRKSIMKENGLLTEKSKLLAEGIEDPRKLVSTKVEKVYNAENLTINTGKFTSSYKGKYSNLINKYAHENNLDPNLIAAMIQKESGFRPNVKSEAGAVGLMQLMPPTAKGLGVKDSSDPEQNIMGGTKYFAQMMKQFDNNIEHALAAYNAGPNKAKKWIDDDNIIKIPYGETSKYVPEVLSIYNSLTKNKSNESATVSTKDQVYKGSDEELKEAESKAVQEKEEVDYQVLVNQHNFIDDVILESNNKITQFQNDRELSSNQQRQFTSDSVEWRKEEAKQSSLLQREQKEVEQQSDKIAKLLEKKKITSEEYTQKIAENNSKIWALEEEIQGKRVNVIRSQMDSYGKKIQDADYQLDLSNAKLNSLTEGSIEYNKALQDQIPILQHKKSLQQAELLYLEKQLTRKDLSPAKIAELTEEFNKLNLELYGTDESLKSINERLLAKKESAADKIIEDFKKVIEQQRDFAIDAIDEQRKAEDERHKERNKHLDDEQKKFETHINARLKAMDRENSSVDYEEELTKKKNERQKIVDKLNVLSLDNSMEAKAKRKDLTEQLSTVDEEIAKYERDRERELVKQGLQDQLDDHKNYTDKLKEEDSDLHETTLANLDDEKKKTERYYKDILEDQKYFYDLKQGLMSNDAAVVSAKLTEIGDRYNELFASIKQHAFETSQEMQNMTYNFQQSMEGIGKFKAGDYSSSDSGSQGNNNSGSTNEFKIQGTTETRKAWTHYLSNKDQAEKIRKEMSLYNTDSYKYQKLEKEFKELQEENQGYRDKYKFPDNSFAELAKLNIFSANTGGMTPSFAGGKFLLAHEKELILNQSDTSNLLKIVDVVRGITDRIKTGLDFSTFKFSENRVAGNTDNRIQIDKVEIMAKDNDTGLNLLGKFEEALNNKLKWRTI
ncbi:phage tail tape measure protein [Paenibacillus xylanexedens]|uniref:phage tail tape measure protein n=1 Tax=Paenibacillus xylanexedens TaxID=528191 RepID=UPI001EFFF6D5|nr:phage tail tape measure protein [Paenibacillus xylanexedens]MCF7755565.1 phage tail tape measure protein [Paenibacillus xylanexedens]